MKPITLRFVESFYLFLNVHHVLCGESTSDFAGGLSVVVATAQNFLAEWDMQFQATSWAFVGCAANSDLDRKGLRR